MLEKIELISRIARNVAVIVLVGGLIYTIPGIVLNIRQTLIHTSSASKALDDYVKQQTAQLSSDRNRKAIEAGIAVAASLQGTVRLVNTQTVPRVNRTLDSLDSTVLELQRNLAASARLIDSTQTGIDKNLNTLNSTLLTGQELIRTTQDKTNLSLDEINRIIASPEWLEVLHNLNTSTAAAAESSKNIEILTQELKTAGASAPGIMKAVEEIAKTTSKYRKAMLLSQIFSSIGRAFF